MPTRNEWINSLFTPRQVVVDSSAQLANRVSQKRKSKSFKGTPKNATSVPTFQQSKSIKISPIEILEALGRITTPKVRNLIDLASIWAYIRYIWAFEPDIRNTNLFLSDYSRYLDPHQKAVLADDLGVGFSAFIVRKYFSGITPVPVSIALRERTIGGLSKRYSTMPDYIFKQRSGGYIVVECKGTTSGMTTSRQQLKRGTEQVPSLRIRKAAPLTLVIGACLMRDRTQINIIDPPDDEDSETVGNVIPVTDEKRLLLDIEAIHTANLMWYCGEYQLAEEVLHRSELFRDFEDDKLSFDKTTRTIKQLDTEFSGIESPAFSLGGGVKARVFQGVQSNIIDTIKINRPINKENSKELFRKAKLMAKPTDKKEDDDSNDDDSDVVLLKSINDRRGSVQALSTDGTLLSIEIE